MSAGFEQAMQRVDASLRLATSSAAKVKTLVDEIQAGSEEQARGIEQIAKAVNRMEQVTRKAARNSPLDEELKEFWRLAGLKTRLTLDARV